jgi:glycerol-3-phosphate acyltransferase PlsY
MISINFILVLAAVSVAYLVGSISSAIIICKLMGLPDPREHGSHNPGATNVLRLGGKKAAALTLLGDLLKGLVPVLIAKWLAVDALIIGLVALFAVLGHLFPILFRFEGGKGVATMLGGLLGLCWQAGLCWMGIWLVVAYLFRYSSLAALVATGVAPFFVWTFTHNTAYVVTVSIIALMLILRHHSNIAKLLAGTENKIGRRTSK